MGAGTEHVGMGPGTCTVTQDSVQENSLMDKKGVRQTDLQEANYVLEITICKQVESKIK